MAAVGKTPLERFTEKYVVNEATGCWEWQAFRTDRGYGGFDRVRAHRWAYEYFVGPIPVGLTLDHLCRVRHCVNPAHLEAVTHAENMARSAPAVKTHCIHGHEYTPESTRIRTGNGRRGCWTCLRTQNIRRYQKRKLEMAA